jgi:hypothetical protein
VTRMSPISGCRGAVEPQLPAPSASVFVLLYCTSKAAYEPPRDAVRDALAVSIRQHTLRMLTYA